MTDRWTEQTLLRLLDLIASSRSLDPAPVSFEAKLPPEHPQGPVADDGSLWQELAEGDAAFGQWLTLHAPREQWPRIGAQWLQWIVAESGTSCGTTTLPAAANGNAASRDTKEVCQSALVASAKAALEVREALQNLEQTTANIARELAYDMAYGLSHELNNPLANIASRARLLAEEEPDKRKQQLLTAIVDQAMRGCEMIADLMLYARPPVPAAESIDLVQLLRDVSCRALPWISARGVTLSVEHPETAVLLMADPNALREVLWAVLRNAIEAARSTIFMGLNSATEHDAQHLSLGNGSPVLVLRISDDGAGLTDHARAHAFHPYFSGREAGRGLGLGLSKVARVMQSIGGYATIENSPAGGCEVCLVWPQIEPM